MRRINNGGAEAPAPPVSQQIRSSFFTSMPKTMPKLKIQIVHASIQEPKSSVNLYSLEPQLYDAGPIMIIPHVYLGCYSNAKDIPTLSKLNITHVVNVAKELPETDMLIQLMTPMSISPSQSTRVEANIQRHHVSWSHGQDISSTIDSAIALIETAVSSGENVLIHCRQGICRSATLIIAYIMKSRNVRLQDAYSLVQHKSPVIAPNVTLLAQLALFETQWSQK